MLSGETLRARMKAVRASQRELAKFMGVDHRVVHRIISGERKALTAEEVDAIKRFFANREPVQIAGGAWFTTAAVRACADVVRERKRQIEIEGFTAERDDLLSPGFLGRAAAAFAYAAGQPTDLARDWVYPGKPARDPDFAFVQNVLRKLWPGEWEAWKPSADPREDLVKAGALILAAIEQVDRKRAVVDQAGVTSAEQARSVPARRIASNYDAEGELVKRQADFLTSAVRKRATRKATVKGRKRKPTAIKRSAKS